MQRRKRCWQQHMLLALSSVFLISTLGAQAQVIAAAGWCTQHLSLFIQALTIQDPQESIYTYAQKAISAEH
jgi:hypothetical protein